jgi:hypothetical protein
MKYRINVELMVCGEPRLIQQFLADNYPEQKEGNLSFEHLAPKPPAAHSRHLAWKRRL